jgi:hypothetical protein
MLTVIDKGNGIVHLEEVPKDFTYRVHRYLNYCTILGRDSQWRMLQYELLPGKTADDLRAILNKYPDARIVHHLAHEPYISEYQTELILGQVRTIQEVAAWQRVQEDGVDVIDEFGFHLYIRGEIDFYGNEPDIDLRYENE